MVNWLAALVKLSGEPSQLCWHCLVNKLAICNHPMQTKQLDEKLMHCLACILVH